MQTTKVAAQAPPIMWSHTYGGADIDYQTHIHAGIGGGFIIAGTAMSINGDIVKPRQGNGDFWLVKTNGDGKIVWENSFGGTGYDNANAVIEVGDGYVVTGTTNSSDGQVTGLHGAPFPHSSPDVWIIKTDDTGKLLWQRTYGGSGLDVANSIVRCSGGGYMVAGCAASPDGDVTASHGTLDFWVIRTDDTGGIIWQKTYGGSGGEMAYYVQQARGGGYVITGSTNSGDGDVTYCHGANDIWVVKLDDTGKIEWQRSFGGTDMDYPRCVRQTNDGGYIVAGCTRSTDGDVTGYHGGTGYDVWVFKTDSLGRLEWQRTYGGTDDEDAKSIGQTTDGGYIVAGYTKSSDGDVAGKHKYMDAWVLKLNDTGAVEWQKALGGSADDDATEIIEDADSNFVIAGSTNSSDSDVTGNHGIGTTDYWVVKLGTHKNTDTVKAVVPIVNTPPILIVPNPTTGTVVVQGTGNVTIRVYNVMGRLLKEVQHTDAISITEFPAGLYFVSMLDSKGLLLNRQRVVKY